MSVYHTSRRDGPTLLFMLVYPLSSSPSLPSSIPPHLPPPSLPHSLPFSICLSTLSSSSLFHTMNLDYFNTLYVHLFSTVGHQLLLTPVRQSVLPGLPLSAAASQYVHVQGSPYKTCRVSIGGEGRHAGIE